MTGVQTCALPILLWSTKAAWIKSIHSACPVLLIKYVTGELGNFTGFMVFHSSFHQEALMPLDIGFFKTSLYPLFLIKSINNCGDADEGGLDE